MGVGSYVGIRVGGKLGYPVGCLIGPGPVGCPVRNGGKVEYG